MTLAADFDIGSFLFDLIDAYMIFLVIYTGYFLWYWPTPPNEDFLLCLYSRTGLHWLNEDFSALHLLPIGASFPL